MESLIYSVLDVKASEFGPVFLAKNDAIARRTVQDSLRGGQSTLARYPEDFLLYRLGVFDGTTGGLIPEERPVIVVAVEKLMPSVERS